MAHHYGCWILDACRFAENARFIKLREDGYADKAPIAINEMFSYADGCGTHERQEGRHGEYRRFLALNDDDLTMRCRNLLILTEGFPTYGGLAGYDLEAIGSRLVRGASGGISAYRIRSIQYLAEKITAAGVPIVQPPGGHAIYLDARAMLPHLPDLQYPAWSPQ
ncbi:MAG: beta-eliminating lyase-related protein [Anaerolineae bacterium]